MFDGLYNLNDEKIITKEIEYYCPLCDEYFYEDELDLNFTCPNCGNNVEEE